MNKVILMGRLTRDPETRYSQSAEPIAISKFSLAVNKRVKREGEPDADFINCVALGKNGEFVDKYFKKGQMVSVVGRLSVRSYDDQQSGQKKWITEVVVEEQFFAESKASFEGRSGSGGSPADEYYVGIAKQEKAPSNGASFAPEGFAAIDESIDDEELPF